TTIAGAAGSRDVRGAHRRDRAAFRGPRGAEAAALGRLPRRAGSHRVLVRRGLPLARTHPLRTYRRRLEPPAAVSMSIAGPRRIVCLTEEPTEVLYALGEQDRIVGISGFTVRPPRARREKPKISAFTSAKIGEILALEPDLAIGFSDIQADIARELVAAGVEVWIANHRSIAGILDYIRRLGAMVGATDAADAYACRAEAHLAEVETAAARLPRRPRVFFEEWDDP